MSEFEQKVLKMLEEINSKLDKVLKAESPIGSTTSTLSISSTPSTTVKPSAIIERQEEEAKLEEKPPVEGRRVCPECGGTSFNAVEDKTQVLHQMGGVKIYAKKYVCRSCGKEM
ncbi:MAG: hypothetical protein ACFFHD_04365 [Promethearchaeota archaeon]